MGGRGWNGPAVNCCLRGLHRVMSKISTIVCVLKNLPRKRADALPTVSRFRALCPLRASRRASIFRMIVIVERRVALLFQFCEIIIR